MSVSGIRIYETFGQLRSGRRVKEATDYETQRSSCDAAQSRVSPRFHPRTDASRMGVLATKVSIEIEFFAVVPFQRGVLVLFAQQGTTAHEHLDLGAHEASEGVLGRAHDR